jgi:cytochrome oxidase assembly protein ShyY1
MAHKSIWRLAATPKWIAGLLIALAVASIFAWLGQWQLGRAVESNQPVQIVKPATVAVMLDTKSVYLVSDRIQDSKPGYWVIANSYTAEGESVVLALGWTEKLTKAEQVRTELMNSMIAQAYIPVTGFTLPTEPPKKLDPQKNYLLESVSTAQIANLIAGVKVMRADYLAVNELAAPDSLEPIKAEISQEAGVNWLSAFYAVEWAVFAGFAVFMWWRLLKDAHIAERLN